LIPDPLGYMANISASGETIELTSELLADVIKLAHPDHHPPERQELANRITGQLFALKPFVFPAQKPEPVKVPECNGSKVSLSETSRPTYPCSDCADTFPLNYCDACKAEWEKRQHEKHERECAEQRKWYRVRKERRERRRPPTTCAACGVQFKGKRKDARFCSDKCRQKAHRKAVTEKNNSRRDIEAAVTEAEAEIA
jgi:hypothetical protein